MLTLIPEPGDVILSLVHFFFVITDIRGFSVLTEAPNFLPLVFCPFQGQILLFDMFEGEVDGRPIKSL